MDRTQINIVSILLSSAGLFIVLTDFNVPEVNLTFLDTNPFAVKRDVIDSIMKWIFTGVALGGFLLRLFAEVSDPPNRSYSSKSHYWIFCAVSIVAVIMLMWMLTLIGHRIARSQWEPKIIELQRETFEHARTGAQQDGTLNDRKAIERQLGFIEELLEVTSGGDLRDRVKRLEPIFSKPHSL